MWRTTKPGLRTSLIPNLHKEYFAKSVAKAIFLKLSLIDAYTGLLNGIKVQVLFGKIVEKKHLCCLDKNHYYF